MILVNIFSPGNWPFCKRLITWEVVSINEIMKTNEKETVFFEGMAPESFKNIPLIMEHKRMVQTKNIKIRREVSISIMKIFYY